ncbi:DUF4296 domain-containing protein [Formosa sp. A9]|uniref:DUF4296 domain-containing protein n=1 Tax=Formosa sp. A9 TaxID=3442641 RepID=UPI003EB87D40
MRIAVFLLSFVLVVSCHKVKKPEQPENLMSEDQMVNVIIDMALLTAAKGVDRVALEEKGIMPEAFVYEKHQIDSLQFALSSNYYAHDIAAYEAIYAKVDDSLKAIKAVIKQQQDEAEEAKRKADSLKKVAMPKVKPQEGKKVIKGIKLDSIIAR